MHRNFAVGCLAVALLGLLTAFAAAQGGDDCDSYRCMRSRSGLKYWELLMQDPAGVIITAAEPGDCLEPQGACLASNECCSNHCGNFLSQPICCVPASEACSNDLDCCSTNCVSGTCANCTAQGDACLIGEDCCTESCGNYLNQDICCLPQGQPCDDDLDCCSTNCDAGSNTCGSPPCFSGDTLVRIQEATEPVAIRDLKTGQHVQCLNSTGDLRVPTSATFCEVINWYHAEPGELTQVRLTFTRPGGATGRLTVSVNHMMVKLTGSSVKAGTTAVTFQQFGSFTETAAGFLTAGDLLAVLTDEKNPAAGFTAVAITAAESVEADGRYIPGLESAYIIADGVVAPVWNIRRSDLAAPAGLDGVGTAWAQYEKSPIFMVRSQAVGTPGTSGVWDGNPKWPGIRAITRAKRAQEDAGKVMDFTALQSWFMPRYNEWKADKTKGITLDEMVAKLKTDDLWVTPSAKRLETEKDKKRKLIGDVISGLTV